MRIVLMTPEEYEIYQDLRTIRAHEKELMNEIEIIKTHEKELMDEVKTIKAEEKELMNEIETIKTIVPISREKLIEELGFIKVEFPDEVISNDSSRN